MKGRKREFILAGDVGGTKTILALFSMEGGMLRPEEETVLASREFPSLAAAVKKFLEGREPALSGAVFGVAGPVIAGWVQATNLPWVVDAGELGRELGGIPVRLLNDLQALGESVPHLPPNDLETLNGGERREGGNMAVIAPGTGLGEGFLVREDDGWRTVPSEGGHADFAPANPLQAEMLSFLATRLGHVSYERVCSGMGIGNLYDFLKESGRAAEPDWLAAELQPLIDRTPVIIAAALEGTAEICRAALDLFVSILGAEAGNLALKVMATAGVYLGGGIPPRILPLLRSPGFMASFIAKGRFAELLERIPLHVITNPKAGLLGAAHFGKRIFA